MGSSMTNATAEIAVEAAGLFPMLDGEVVAAMMMQGRSIEEPRETSFQRVHVDLAAAEERLKLRALQHHHQTSIQALARGDSATQSILSLFR